MTAHPQSLKNKAIELRKQGCSLQELSNKLGISKSTASLWSRNVILNNEAIQVLEKKKKIGQSNLVYALAKNRLTKEREMKAIQKTAFEVILNIKFNIDIHKLLCAFLFWAEGCKRQSGIRFINSDPKMISTYLFLFRSGYKIDERKLKVKVHIHEYHNEEEIKNFWSVVTSIPLNQFYRCYTKPNTGKRIRADYKGCASIYYNDYKIAAELQYIYNAYALLQV
jgi:transcriptional regulator with XRE-family HTH domain